MKKSMKNAWFLKVLALVLALGLLIGAAPAAALDGETTAQDETVVSETPSEEETPAEDETVIPDEQSEGDAEDGEEIDGVPIEADSSTEKEPVASKGDKDLAETAEAPAGVTIDVDEGSYESYNDYYYTGIKSIEISFTKPDELTEEQLKVAFDQNLTETEDYDRVDWWDDYGNLTAYRDLYIDGDDVEIEMDIEEFVDFRYNSEGFSDGKADGIYTLVFSYDIDGDGNPILYSQDFMIDNAAPTFSEAQADSNDVWVTDANVSYAASDAGCGVAKVQLYYFNKGYYYVWDFSNSPEGNFAINKSGSYEYAVKTIDNLGNESPYLSVGTIKVDKASPAVGENVDYDKAAPGSDEWTNEAVEATFSVTAGDSGVKSVKIKDSSKTVKDKGDGKYAVTFEDDKDITVVVTANNGKTAEKKIAAPQVDTTKPDKDSIRNVGVKRSDETKLLNLLTFGLYDNQDITLTVYASDSGSPIAEISADNAKAVKMRGFKVTDGVASQDFTLSPGSTAEDSDFTNLKFTLKDAAGNESEAAIALKDIVKFTVDSESTVEKAGAELGELITTNIAPDISEFTITSDKSGDSVYRSDVEIKTTVTENLTGLKSVKVYFDKADKFDKENNYKPREGVKDVSSCVSAISSETKTKSATVDYTVDNDSASGSYVIYVEAKNNSGNTLAHYKQIVIDKDEPKLEITSKPDDWTNTEGTKIVISAADQPEGGSGIEKVTVNGTEITPDEDGAYSFNPEAGKEYEIEAIDLFGNKTTLEKGGIKLTPEQVKFDDKAPTISAFTYSNDNNAKWSDKVTVTFTVDDKLDGKTLSGVNKDSFTLTKADGSATAAEIKPEYDDINDVYNCSFTAADNNTAYTINVKDKAGNAAEAKTTEVIKRDDSEPVIEKIVFANIANAKKFGVYGKGDVLATVYVKSGHSAPVDDIKLYNDKTEISSDAAITEDGEYFIKSFAVPEAETNGSAYKKLGAYAKSAAGVHTRKDTEDGIVGIADINVYVGDAPLDKLADFFEAVAKTTGPAVTAEYTYPATFNGALGYEHKDDGSVDAFGIFTFEIEDEIAGVDDDTVKVYFDTADKFTVDGEGKYIPKSDAKEMAVTWTPAENDPDKKNTKTTGTFAETAATDSGSYVLCAVAKNLSGVEKITSEKLDIDNSAPVIGDVTYLPVDGKNPSEKWVNSDVTVEFTVTDKPDAVSGGVETVTVTGDVDGEDYAVTDLGGGKYSFTTGISQTYTVKANDNFHIKADDLTTARVLVDQEPAHISVPELISYQNNWTADEKTITFTVDDLSDYEKYTDDADKQLSGIDTIVVTDADGSEYPLKETVDKTAQSRTYSFIATRYSDYTVTVTDIAGNVKTSDEDEDTKLSEVKVDTEAPVIDNVSFSKADTSVIDRILHFLTFGIYADKDVSIQIKGTDPFASSKIKDVKVVFTDAKTEKTTEKTAAKEITGGDPDACEIDAAIEINNGLISDSRNITIEITDMVDHTTGVISLSQLYSEHKVTVPDGFMIADKDFEVIIHENAPVITGIQPYANSGDTKEFVHDGTYWYSDNDFSVDFSATDDISKLHGLTVTLNGDSNDITTECTETGTSTALKKTYTDFEIAADPSTRNDEIVTEKNGTVSIPALSDQSILRYVSQVSAANQISITAQGNNGITNTVSAPDIFIDDIAPEITKFEFTGDGVSELEGDPADLSHVGDTLDGVTGDNYVYFFKDQAEVTITATDTHSGIKGSGVRQIHLITIGTADVDGPGVNSYYHSDVSADNNGDLTASFTIPAGFRGSLYAYATDQVENDGRYYNPHNLIAENYDLHAASSSTAITVDNTNYVTTDNNGHPLYNGDVLLTLTVEDRFSGIKTVDYSFDGIESSAHYSGTVSIDNDGNITDSKDRSWTVEETDKNLVTRISMQITLDGFGSFNSNDIMLSLSGYDRSGYAIDETTRTVSIDTTKPVIEVTYDPAAGSGNTYGTDEYEYFKVSRTMNVVVYERNFDPALFDYSGILNNYVSGDVPALAAGENWSTSYSDYTDSSAHYASFTFANDGDYAITLDCTDEATNKADTYTGEKFTIDNIDPTVEVSLNPSAPVNGKYYNQKVTATITVHEHNFAEGDTYVTFTPTKTDYDTSYDTSPVAPALTGWSESGTDTHVTTVEFSTDGIYSFTFDYQDKALRAAQQFTQNEFVVDKNIDKLIEFIDVDNATAYNGEIIPKVRFTDTNLDTADTMLTRVSLDISSLTQSTDEAKIDHTMTPLTGSQRTDAYVNFPSEVENDGIYELEATGTDLAGNTKTETILFSVNRFGSTFMLTKASGEWVGKGFTNTADELEVIEINVNEVTDQAVSVSHNSQTQKLAKKSNFDFSFVGGEENWYRYNYDIYQNNFAEEGNYSVTVSSTDTFNKSVSNRTAYVDEEKGIVKNCPIAFVVDQTAPSILIEGVESDTPYGDPEKTVQIICTDTNIDPESLVITDENGAKLQEGTDYQVEALAGELDIELLVDKAGKHSLSVSVADLAENSSADAVTDFELNASIFTLFFHNTAAVVGTAIGLAALVGLAIFLILKRRKKQEQG